jgi:hypothetical protein
MTKGPIGKHVVSFSPPSRSLLYNNNPPCVFPPLANDTHIVGLTSNVGVFFLKLQKFLTLGLLVQPKKCVIWSPHGLDHSISLPSNFLIFNFDFRILGRLVGSKSFVESFAIKALHENLGMIFCLPMLANLQAAFTMLSLCYT